MDRDSWKPEFSLEMGSEEGPKLPLSNDELPAAFWDAMPSEDHPDLQAINALKEEDSPDERAETLKVDSSCNLCNYSAIQVR